MHGLFFALYLNEDVDILIADFLRSGDFSATTIRKAGQLQNSDDDQLAYAAHCRCALVTHNCIDFEMLAEESFAAGKTHHGITIALLRPPREIARCLSRNVNHATAEETQNQVLYI